MAFLISVEEGQNNKTERSQKGKKNLSEIRPTFHCDSGDPTIVTFRSACWESFWFSSMGAIFTDAPLNLIMLRMCDPLVPIIAPTALLGMYKYVVS